MLPLTGLSIVALLNAEVAVLFLGALASEEAVAGLRVAARAAGLVALPLLLVNAVIAPRVAALGRGRTVDRAALQRLSRQSARVALVVATFGFLLFLLLGQWLLNVLLGPAYVDLSYPSLVIIGAGQLFNVALGSVGVILNMTGHERVTFTGHLAGLVVLLLGCITLVPVLAQVGAAIAIAASLVVWNGLLAFAVVKNLGIRPGFL